MTWQLALLIALCASSAAALLQRYIQRDSKLHPLGFPIISGLSSAAPFLVVSIFHGFDTNWSTLPLFNYVLSFGLWATCSVLLIYALRNAGAAQFTLISNTSIIWSLLVVVIFLHNPLTIMMLLGTFLLLCGALLASYGKGINLRSKALIYSVLTALFFGLATANEGIVLSHGYDLASYFLAGFLIPAVILMAFPGAAKSAVAILKTRTVNWQVLLLGLLYATNSAALLRAFQLKHYNFAPLLSLDQLTIILVVIGSIVILKEKQFIKLRVIATAISIIGALLVINH